LAVAVVVALVVAVVVVVAWVAVAVVVAAVEVVAVVAFVAVTVKVVFLWYLSWYPGCSEWPWAIVFDLGRRIVAVVEVGVAVVGQYFLTWGGSIVAVVVVVAVVVRTPFPLSRLGRRRPVTRSVKCTLGICQSTLLVTL
jgi:hypothetical protein